MTISVDRKKFQPERCPVCKGRGLVNWEKDECQTCYGSGVIVINQETGEVVVRRSNERDMDQTL